MHKEHFFPFNSENANLEAKDFNSNEISDGNKMMNDSNTLSAADCMLNYVAKSESVGNVCTPVSTFNNELNAQGLNYPEGFDRNTDSNGYPLM